MTIDGNIITFSTGKKESVNLGIIGLDPKLNLTEGYDSELWAREYDEEFEEFTREELVEIADHMLERWQKFRESVAMQSREETASKARARERE